MCLAKVSMVEFTQPAAEVARRMGYSVARAVLVMTIMHEVWELNVWFFLKYKLVDTHMLYVFFHTSIL